jgi:predicted DCC family thiol-disulfide oxidoreductase YuxK
MRQDNKNIFRFAALQSDAGQRLLKTNNIPANGFNSFILIDNGKVYKSSTAGLRLYNKLPWYWKWTQIFWIVPKFIRDGVYNVIAKNRYKWFGKKEECMIPNEDVKNRFIQE